MGSRAAPLSTVRALAVAGLAAGLTFAMIAPARADGPPAPGPYPRQPVADGEPAGLRCLDADGTPLYDGPAWTLEPLVRGPAFAPVVLYLDGAGDVPVLPLDLTIMGWPVLWTYPDGTGGAPIEHGYGRPVGYGPTPTDTAPRVRCRMSMLGHYDFGSYRITAGLRQILGLPAETLNRTLRFDNEADVEFTIPRYLFPLTAGVRQTALPVPDRATHPRVPLPRVTCVDGARTRYRGAAYTLDVLVRGYRWAPMALWLDGDRIVTPQWFTSSVTGAWRTVSGTPARSGRLDVTASGRPRAYGAAPADPTGGVACRWGGEHRTVTTVTTALARQLRLPAAAVGRRVELTGDYTTSAYAPRWLFPPA